MSQKHRLSVLIVPAIFFLISIFMSTSAVWAADINVNVVTSKGTAISGIKVYAYTEAGSCTDVYTTTDTDGIAVFDSDSFTEGDYKFKADCLGYYFWSQVVALPDTLSVDLNIETETAEVTVTTAAGVVSGIKVYLYSDTESCLCLYETTDADGLVSFELPVGNSFKFKAVILGNKYWSDVITIASGITNNAAINAGGGTLQVVVDKGTGIPLSGIKTKLYNPSDSYLGIYQTTDESGVSQFSLPEGTFKIRADYLGSQYWTDDTVVTEDTNVGITIPHQDVVVTVQGLYQDEILPIEGIKAYLYSSSDSYLYQYGTTDSDGNVIFNLPEQAFKVRVTHMDQQYWSDEFSWQDIDINIPMADAEITVSGAGDLLEGAKVYVYSEEGSYLCKYGITDENGRVTFRVPAGSYNFRAYYLGNEYWSGIQTLIADQSASISIDAGGGEFILTVSKDSSEPITGLTCCLYSEAGSYLGRYIKTDSEGQASFKLPDGSFKFKVHYLGSQFWSDLYNVPDALTGAVVIPHKDVVIIVQGTYQGNAEPIQDIKAYIYSSSDSCLGIYGTTDAEGQVTFNLPEISFKVGVYYLGKKYWSDEFTWQDTTISIPYGMASVHVTKNNSDVQDAWVYLLSEEGSCLGKYDTTDSSGLAEFIIPSGSYKFKAYSGGVTRYSDTAILTDDQTTSVNIDLSDPPTVSFSAAPESIYAGELSELTWDVINADTVHIDHDIGYVDLDGSITVNLTETTTYTLTAAGPGGTATAGVTITYINSAPTAYDQTVNTNEDEQVAISLAALDADNDSLLYLVASGPFHGVLSGDAPDLEYLPDADYNGADYFTFIVNDGSVDSEAATINIDIIPVNDIPTADAGDDQTVLEDETVSLDGTLSSDPDGDTLSFQWAFVSMPEESSASLMDPTSSTPSFIADQSGTYEVMLIVNDGNADSLPDTVIITAEPLIVEVPDVTGMSQSEAETTIMGSGLVAGDITTAYDEDIPEGCVISQQPEPGALIETGGAVDLVISLGPSDLTGNGEISGTIIDALTGAVLPDAEISLFMEQEDETFTLIFQYSSLEDGSYIFSDLPSGDYFIETVLEDYITGENTLILDSDDSIVIRDIVLSPLMSSGEVRIVLTWGETPEDLEAHLTAPNTEGCRYHCFYDNREITGASLDLDDMTSYGPETITMTSFSPGTYRYYVHDFTNRTSTTSDALSVSGAQVKVYFGSGEEPVEFTVPDQEGTVWHVFDMDGETQQITPLNIMAFQEEPGEIDFPVITSSPKISANIGEAYTYQVTADDPDDDILVYSFEEYPEGMAIDQLTGEIEWTPSDDQGGYHEVSIKVSDGRCGEDTQTFQIYVTYVPIVNFTSDPCSAYNQDGTITLTWSTERAETVYIDQGIGEVESTGSITITSPDEPVIYTLTAENESGQNHASVPKIPGGTFAVTPSVLPATGGTATLTWDFPCAVTCNIQGIGDVSTSDSMAIDVTEVPVTYVIKGKNASGSSISTASIREECSESIVIEMESDAVCSWTPGDILSLSWETISGCVDSCEIDQGIGEVESTGTIDVAPDEATTYTITCSGDSGMGQESITLPKILNVKIGSFYAGSSYILLGQSVKLTWTTQCAETCTIDQGIGEVDTDGSIMVTPSSLPITYTLTVTGKEQTLTKSVTINPRVTATFDVSPSTLKIGESATLTWTTVNAEYCEIDNGIGEVDLNGTITVQPSGNTIYKLIARGSADSDIKYVTVIYIAPTAQLLADKEVIEEGESVTLSWVFSNAETCTINQDIGEVLEGESVVVTPEDTTTYTMTAEGPGGTAKDSITITVLHPPSITVVQPDGVFDTANQYYSIKWIDEDGDSNASISLYYDTDNTGADGILIASGILEDIDPTGNDYDKYIWNTSEMEEGTYYVYAVIDDGYHDPITDYSDGPVTIDHSISSFKIKADDGESYDSFGNSVAMDNGYAIVGTYRGIYASGAAYIFKQEDESWVQQAKLIPDDSNDDAVFGYSVSISGDYAVVGAFGDDELGTDAGAVYIYKRDNDVWVKQAKLTAPDGNDDDFFGESVSISDDLLIIGASGDDENGSDIIYDEMIYEITAGAAYIYKLNGSNWILQQKLFGSGGIDTKEFGCSVDIRGDRAVVGADYDDAAYIFEYNGSNWMEKATFSSSDGKGTFGSVVSIDGDYSIIGARYYNSYVGAACIFSSIDSIWSLTNTLEPADIETGDYFASSVSINGNHVIIGSPGDDDAASGAGAAYLYEGEYDEYGNIASWTAKTKVIATDPEAYDSFGASVYLNDGYAIIGSMEDDDNGSDSGAAYIYPMYLAVRGSAAPDIFEKGGSTILSWNSVLADSCSISPDIGSVSPYGSTVVSPSETTTYVITAENADGSVSENVTVTVVDPSILPSVDVSASPATIGYSDSTTLTWNSDNATYCTIEPGIGTVPASGTIFVSPTEDTTYTVTAINSGGETTASVTVTVVCYNPILTAYIEPDSIELGDSATITWSSTYTDYCEIQPDVGLVEANGSITVSPEDTTTYIITATGHCGTSVYNLPLYVTGATSIEVTYPNSVNDYADEACKIRWKDTGPNIDATISLYYDSDNSGEDGTLIVSGINETPDGDSGDSYIWDTSNMPEGTYYIYAVLEDGINSALIDYSEGPINIIHSTPEELKVSGKSSSWELGYSVAISGDYAIASDSECLAYIFTHDGAVWSEQATLIPEDLEEYDFNENSVSIDGDYAIVGVNYIEAAYIFIRQNGVWVQQDKLLPSDSESSDYFGCSVSINGDYAIVGAERGDDNIYPYYTGATYIFKREGTTWIEQAKLLADDGGGSDFFGHSVSMNGDYAVIGAHNADMSTSGLYDSGAAYIFKREGEIWLQQAKLTASDAGLYDYFGASVSIDGNKVIIGATNNDNSGYNSAGAAYIFRLIDGVWTQEAKLIAPDPGTSKNFGCSVDIKGNKVIIGADYLYGNGTEAAYIYQYDGANWNLQKQINGESTWNGFGGSVGISDNYAVVGASYDDDAGGASGAVYFYPLAFVEISVDPETVLSGESATLTWSSNFADSCTIEPDIGTVDADGSLTVTPSETTTYTISATGYGITATDQVTITVTYPLPTVSISAEPATIDIGDSCVLTWNTTDAESCVIDNGIGDVDVNGSITVTPTEDTTYTITATGPGGTATAFVTVTVTYPVPTVDIEADYDTILEGDSATLTWTSTDATECSIDQDIGSVSLNGSISVSPFETTTYTISATNPDNTAIDTVTIYVTTYPAVTGIVTDGETGDPVEGVSVTIIDSDETRSCVTGTAGQYLIGNITPGSIAVLFEKEEYQTVTGEYTISENQILDISVTMQKELVGATLQGTVTDGTTGQVLEGVYVTVTDVDKSQSVGTGSDGSYSIEGISLGEVEISADYTGYFSEIQTTSFTDNAVYDLDILLYSESATATVNGAIINAETLLPEPDVSISVNDTGISDVTDEDGNFTLADVPMGEQTFYVIKEDFVDVSFGSTIDEDPYQMDLVFPNATGVAYPAEIDQNITGYIYDSLSGKPIENAIVKVSGTEIQAVTGADGQYTLSDLPLSKRELIAMAVDHEAVYMYPTVVSGGADNFDFFLPPSTSGSLTGTVTDADTGEPVRYVSIEIEDSLLSACTEADGTYTLVGVPTGEYTFKAVHPEYLEEESSLVMVEDETTSSLDFLITHRPVTGSLEGIITDIDTGDPVSGASLSVDGTEITGSTDSVGYYLLSDVPAGLVDISIEATGYVSATRTTAVIADEDYSTPTITTADFELDDEDPDPEDSISDLIYAADGGFIETPDHRFMLVIPPDALSGDAIVTLMSPTTGPIVNPGDELSIDPAFDVTGIKALGKMTQVVIEPAVEGDDIPTINNWMIVSGRYSQAEADEYNIAESSIFPYYWDSDCWTVMRVKPYEMAVDTINNIPIAVLDFTTTEDGYPILAKQGTREPIMLADLSDWIPDLDYAMIYYFHLAGIPGTPPFIDSPSNVHIYDKDEIETEVNNPPHINALPLFIIHGWDPWSTLFNMEGLDPNSEENRYYNIIEDLLNATNGVYRIIFVSSNSRAGIWSIGNDLARQFELDDYKGLQVGSDTNTGVFPYLDAFGYSAGGLIVRNFQNLSCHVHNMVLAGTPNHGTFDVIDHVTLLGLLKIPVKKWSQGTADILAYDDRVNYNDSTNYWLALLNKNSLPPGGDLTLIAGTDSNELGGEYLELPNDSIVSESSVYCLTSDPYDGDASLLSVYPSAKMLKYDFDFNHHNFGWKDYRIESHQDLQDAITHGLSDWIVAKTTDAPEPTMSGTIPNYIVYAKIEVDVEYNVFEQNEKDHDRESRDIDRVALVIYGKSVDGPYRIGGMADPSGNIIESASISGNSKYKGKVPLSAEVWFDKTQEVTSVTYDVVPLKPDQTSVPLAPLGKFGLP